MLQIMTQVIHTSMCPTKLQILNKVFHIFIYLYDLDEAHNTRISYKNLLNSNEVYLKSVRLCFSHFSEFSTHKIIQMHINILNNTLHMLYVYLSQIKEKFSHTNLLK
jgi:hypothetical protein